MKYHLRNHLENSQWEYSEQTLALVSSVHTGILACLEEKTWGQDSVLQMSEAINRLKTGHVELSGKVCVQCALAQPQASHPASNHFQRLTESSNSSYLPFLISTSSQRMMRTKMTTLYPRFANTRKGEKFHPTEFSLQASHLKKPLVDVEVGKWEPCMHCFPCGICIHTINKVKLSWLCKC